MTTDKELETKSMEALNDRSLGWLRYWYRKTETPTIGTVMGSATPIGMKQRVKQ